MAGVDATVIGGGVVGSAVAYHLARDGHDTLLLDRRDEGRATDAGAGILSPPTPGSTARRPVATRPDPPRRRPITADHFHFHRGWLAYIREARVVRPEDAVAPWPRPPTE